MADRRAAVSAVAIMVGILTVGIAGWADVPVAYDDYAVTNEGTPITVDVLANDSGLGDVPLTVIPMAPPANGSVTVDGGNNIFYRPVGGYNGTETIPYRVCDVDAECDDANVIILVNDAPIAISERVYTPKDASVAVVLKARDQDINPADPLAHPITFSLVGRPEHGKLAGDLLGVSYLVEQAAEVELQYTPDEGFVGVDQIVFAATDIHGAMSTAVIDIDVGQRPTQGELTGHAGAYVAFAGPPFGLASWKGRVWARYWYPDLSLEAVLQFDESGWAKATLIGEYEFSDLLASTATVELQPLAAAFDYLRIVTDFRIDPISFSHTLHLPVLGGGYHEIGFRTRVCDASVRGELRIPLDSLCGGAFEQLEISASWPWIDCGMRIDADLSMVCPDGFDSWSVTLRDVPIFALGKYGVDVLGQIQTTFTADAKSALTGLRLKLPSADVCVRLGAELVGPDNTWKFDGINVHELEIQATFAGDVLFLLKESLDDGTELISLSGPLVVCCGSAGRWSVAMSFPAPGLALFDWNRLEAELEVPFGEDFEFQFGAAWNWDATWFMETGWSLAW